MNRPLTVAALAVIAMADGGNLLHCPDTYMAKIAAGPVGKGVVDLDKSPTENLRALAEAKRCKCRGPHGHYFIAAAPRGDHSRSSQSGRAYSFNRRR